jgi:hypothetical protein
MISPGAVRLQTFRTSPEGQSYSSTKSKLNPGAGLGQPADRPPPVLRKIRRFEPSRAWKNAPIDVLVTIRRTCSATLSAPSSRSRTRKAPGIQAGESWKARKKLVPGRAASVDRLNRDGRRGEKGGSGRRFFHLGLSVKINHIKDSGACPSPHPFVFPV